MIKHIIILKITLEIIPVYDRLEITLRVIINKIIFRSLSKRHVNITYS